MRAGSRTSRLPTTHPVTSIVCAATLALALALALVACGATTGDNAPPYTAPPQWHAVSPPTADPIASYAISPDVPGLIVACTGAKTGNMSASPLGPATLWRTRDGGTHWQRLAVSGYIAGCAVAFPAGGKGTLFALNQDGGPFIQVSHDAGDTWSTVVRDDANPYGDIQQRFALLAHGVYRDGRLYTAGQSGTTAADSAAATATASSLSGAPASTPATAPIAASAFSVSPNDSQTWTAVETAPDPLLLDGYTPLAVAADYSAPNAWFRLWGPGNSPAPAGPAILEHSTDGGQTWQPLGPLGERGLYVGIGDGGPGSASLATEPSEPGRLCAALIPMITGQGAGLSASSSAAGAHVASVYIPAGPPAPIPQHVILAGSDDGGHTWSAAVIARHDRDYGEAAGPTVAMDPSGACYLADVTVNPIGDTTNDVSTIWRLAPSRATPATIAKITGQAIVTFAISLDSGTHTPRLVAVTRTYTGPTEIVCQGNTCPPEPPMPPPHLIWTPPYKCRAAP